MYLQRRGDNVYFGLVITMGQRLRGINTQKAFFGAGGGHGGDCFRTESLFPLLSFTFLGNYYSHFFLFVAYLTLSPAVGTRLTTGCFRCVFSKLGKLEFLCALGPDVVFYPCACFSLNKIKRIIYDFMDDADIFLIFFYQLLSCS